MGLAAEKLPESFDAQGPASGIESTEGREEITDEDLDRAFLRAFEEVDAASKDVAKVADDLEKKAAAAGGMTVEEREQNAAIVSEMERLVEETKHAMESVRRTTADPELRELEGSLRDLERQREEAKKAGNRDRMSSLDRELEAATARWDDRRKALDAEMAAAAAAAEAAAASKRGRKAKAEAPAPAAEAAKAVEPAVPLAEPVKATEVPAAAPAEAVRNVPKTEPMEAVPEAAKATPATQPMEAAPEGHPAARTKTIPGEPLPEVLAAAAAVVAAERPAVDLDAVGARLAKLGGESDAGSFVEKNPKTWELRLKVMEMNASRDRLAEVEAKLSKFEGLGFLRALTSGGKEERRALEEELEQAKAEYERFRAEYVGEKASRMLKERMRLADQRFEELANEKGLLTKAYDAYKKLGEMNLTKLGWNPTSRVGRIIARAVSVRTGISLGLAGAGLALGAGAAAGAAAILGRRVFAGAGTAVGSYDLMRMVADRSADKFKDEDLAAMPVEELNERMEKIEARAMIGGKPASENDAYRALRTELSRRLEGRKELSLADRETLSGPEGSVAGMMAKADKRLDELKTKSVRNDRILKGIAGALGLVVGSGALAKGIRALAGHVDIGGKVKAAKEAVFGGGETAAPPVERPDAAAARAAAGTVEQDRPVVAERDEEFEEVRKQHEAMPKERGSSRVDMPPPTRPRVAPTGGKDMPGPARVAPSEARLPANIWDDQPAEPPVEKPVKVAHVEPPPERAVEVPPAPANEVAINGGKIVFSYDAAGKVTGMMTNVEYSGTHYETLLNDDWRATVMKATGGVEGDSTLRETAISDIMATARTIDIDMQAYDALVKAGRGASPEAAFLKKHIDVSITLAEKQYGDVFRGGGVAEAVPAEKKPLVVAEPEKVPPPPRAAGFERTPMRFDAAGNFVGYDLGGGFRTPGGLDARFIYGEGGKITGYEVGGTTNPQDAYAAVLKPGWFEALEAKVPKTTETTKTGLGGLFAYTHVDRVDPAYTEMMRGRLTRELERRAVHLYELQQGISALEKAGLGRSTEAIVLRGQAAVERQGIDDLLGKKGATQ